jgi:hypothetical protein
MSSYKRVAPIAKLEELHLTTAFPSRFKVASTLSNRKASLSS